MEDTEWMPASSSSWSNRNYPNGMRRKIGYYLLSSLRNAPTGDLDHHQCPLIHTIEKGSDQEFPQTFRVSRFVFAAILNELKADLQSILNELKAILNELKADCCKSFVPFAIFPLMIARADCICDQAPFKHR